MQSNNSYFVADMQKYNRVALYCVYRPSGYIYINVLFVHLFVSYSRNNSMLLANETALCCGLFNT